MKLKYISILPILAILLLNSSCLKKEPKSTLTQVLLVPLSPNAILVNFSVNGNVLATQVGYSTATGTTRYTLPYYSFEAKAGSTISYNNQNTNLPIASINTDLNDEKVYSTFLIDSFNKAKAVLVNDDLSEPTTPGNIKIRFFHFSPNAPTINVGLVGNASNLWSNRSFNDQATTQSWEKFIELPAGSYSFEFRNASTGAVAYTIPTQTLLADRIYTIAARGFVGGAGNQALGGWVYPNKP
jgi:hypothetical protein